MYLSGELSVSEPPDGTFTEVFQMALKWANKNGCVPKSCGVGWGRGFSVLL